MAPKILRSLVPLGLAVAMTTLAGCGDGNDDPLSTTTTVPPRTTTSAATTSTTGGATDVAVQVDGRPVALRLACQGADGAVVAIADTGRRIILVREEGLAIRIGTEGGTFAETDDVEAAETERGTRYTATVAVEGDPTRVEIEVATGADLDPCAD